MYKYPLHIVNYERLNKQKGIRRFQKLQERISQQGAYSNLTEANQAHVC